MSARCCHCCAVYKQDVYDTRYTRMFGAIAARDMSFAIWRHTVAARDDEPRYTLRSARAVMRLHEHGGRRRISAAVYGCYVVSELFMVTRVTRQEREERDICY